MPGFIDTPLLDQVSADSNEPARGRLSAGGFEICPVDDVARAAWDAVHGDRVHVTVGKMAKRLSRLARFFPGLIAKQSKKIDGLGAARVARSEERRVGNECVSQCRSRWSPNH